MKKYSVNVNGTLYEVGIELISESEIGKAQAAPAKPAPAAAPAKAAPASAPAQSGSGDISSPMPGNIWEVKVAEGQAVKAGDVLIILEAMKMENEITAPTDGTVTKIAVKKGDVVESQQLLCVLS